MPADGSHNMTWLESFTDTIIFALICTVGLLGIAWAIVSGMQDHKKEMLNKDPKSAIVTTLNGDTKYCDGTTLIYSLQKGGGNAIPNSPECVVSK